MKTIKQKALGTFALIFLAVNAFAQLIPPGGCTNCPPYTNNFVFVPTPYVPGLKLSVPGLSGTNLPINLLEADPAGTYDVFAASNLVGAAWSDVLQGTNGQTNFTLSFPFTDMGFFRAARTDPAVEDAAGLSFYFLNGSANTNIVQAAVQGDPAAATAILVDSTNFADAVWIPFTSMPLVDVGTNEGTHEVWFGFKGTNGIVYWTMDTIVVDTTPPSIVITNPVFGTTDKPIIQVQGYSMEPLDSIYFDVTNAAGILTNQQGFVTSQFFDTNTFASTTNYFQCFDVPLVQGTNFITLHATDLAGNVTTTNVAITLDFSDDTNLPVVQITWPQNGTQIGATNFTLDGQVDNETAAVSASITDTNGDTNVVAGLVERNGKFWVEEIPLNPGTNNLTLTVTDAAGNMSVTNINIVQGAITLTMDAVTPDSQLWQPTVNLTGKISDATYSVWVNGVEGTNNGDGTWSANNVPTTSGGTASFTMTANATTQNKTDTDKPPIVFVNQYSDDWVESDDGDPSWGASKEYSASYDNSNSFSYVGNGAYFYHFDFDGDGWWDVSYDWSSDDPAGTYVSTGDDASGPGSADGSGTGFSGFQNADPYDVPSTSLVDNYVWGNPKLSHFYANINYNWVFPQLNNDQVNYTRTSRTFLQLKTGGKVGVSRKNLFLINAGGTEYGKTPYPVSWYDAPDFWDGTPTTSIDPTRIRVLGKNVGNDGNLFTVLPDNATLDLNASAQGSHYSLNITATKHTPGDCEVSIQNIDDAYEPGLIPDSSDCDANNPANYIHYGQTGHFQISRTGDVLRPLWVPYGLSGTASGDMYSVGYDLPFLLGHPMTPQLSAYLAPGVTNLIIAVSPKYDPINYGTRAVDISILPDSPNRFDVPPNPPPYYTIGQTNATVYVSDSDVDAWFPVLTYPSGNPVPTNGVVEGYGEFHREDYNPTNGCGSGGGGSDVGIGPFIGNFYLATKATLGTDFSFQSDACTISPAGTVAFQNDADGYNTNKLEKINFYFIQTSFCIGFHIDNGPCSDVSYLTNSPFSFTVLSNNVASPGYKAVRLFSTNPMQQLISEFPVPPLSQLGGGDLGGFYIQN